MKIIRLTDVLIPPAPRPPSLKAICPFAENWQLFVITTSRFSKEKKKQPNEKPITSLFFPQYARVCMQVCVRMRYAYVEYCVYIPAIDGWEEAKREIRLSKLYII